MFTNLREFDQALEESNRKLAVRSLLFQKKIAFEFASRVINRTSVDEGPTRARWSISFGVPPSGLPAGADKAAGEAPADDFAGGPTVTRVLGQISAVSQPYGVMFLGNNSPNSEVLEFGGFPTPPKPSRDRRPGRKGQLLTTDTGHSRQAPRGMLAVSLEDVNAAFPDTRPTDDNAIIG